MILILLLGTALKIMSTIRIKSRNGFGEPQACHAASLMLMMNPR
jgi:hypothetical protein